MVDDLELSRRQIGERQAALSKANAYLENLLESLTAGVLTVDGDGCLRQFNGNAEQLLKTPLSPLKGKHFRDWTAAEDIAALVGEFMQGGGDVAEHRRAEGERMLVVRLRRLTSAGGMLVIVDDISRQIKAEREAVWEEASQRFAHEIKNPLTPIRLAAERLENKLGDKLEGEERGMLSRLFLHHHQSGGGDARDGGRVSFVCKRKKRPQRADGLGRDGGGVGRACMSGRG